MIKIDLARSIAEQMNIHTKNAETFQTTYTDIVSDSLASGEFLRFIEGRQVNVLNLRRTAGILHTLSPTKRF